jgi:hypothetical protein
MARRRPTREPVAQRPEQPDRIAAPSGAAATAALCEPVPLVLSKTLCEPGTPTRHVYFPTEGFISLVA